MGAAAWPREDVCVPSVLTDEEPGRPGAWQRPGGPAARPLPIPLLRPSFLSSEGAEICGWWGVWCLRRCLCPARAR